MKTFKTYLNETKEIRGDLTFVRYGGLSPVKQKKERGEPENYHYPPANRGIYAFVWPYIELFLVGTGGKFDQRRQTWLRDKQGNRIENPQDWTEETEKIWDKYEKYSTAKTNDGKYYYIEDKKRKKFKYNGEIWHHLKVKQNQILEVQGDWFLTSMFDYKNVLRKEVGRMAVTKKREGFRYSYDHLEVFIEKI